LLSRPELVEDGHMRCVAGEFVVLSNRYASDPRFADVAGDIGVRCRAS
jgi:hypothetical protein